MIVLYHGSRRWSGPPQILPGSKGRSEHGPGIYLTTSIETARKYARGGGRVIRFEIRTPIRWIDDPGTRIPIEEMVSFLESIYRLRGRDKIIDDLERYAARVGRRDLPPSVLVNLMVNYDALVGEAGPRIAAFLVSHGIDAAIDARGQEDWVVLFNPDLVLRAEPLTDRDAKDVERVSRNR